MSPLSGGGPAFSNVDASGDPGFFFEYIDTVNALPLIASHKTRTVRALALQPGCRVLDVGCGLGQDAAAMAKWVGPHGKVFAIDKSERMLNEARRRTAGTPESITFLKQEAEQMAFADACFAAVRSDRVLQHAEQPEQIISEMIRVTGFGGIVLATEPDWGTLTLDCPNPILTREFLAFRAEQTKHPWIGRQLRGFLCSSGLRDVDVFTDTLVLTDLVLIDRVFRIHEFLERAGKQQLLSYNAQECWWRGLQEYHSANRLFASITYFAASGRKR